jgi:hypothetical protein
LYREAALSWTTPFFTALSISPAVSGRSFFAASALPSAIAARSYCTWVFSWERFFRLRARRFSPWRICFRADAWCATLLLLLT